MKWQIGLLSLLALLGARAWALPSDVFPLSGIDPTTITDDSDLHAVDEIIGNVQTVGLGEAIHTSEGYHEAKSRIIRYLVEKKGFRVFAMETPRLMAAPAVQYIATCSGTSSAAINSIFPEFSSVTVQSLFTWLCQFNKSHPKDPVRFFGFDMQEPSYQVQAVSAFLTAHAPQDASRLTTPLYVCNGAGGPSSPAMSDPISAATLTSCEKAADDVIGFLKRSTSFANVSIDEMASMHLSLQGLKAWENQQYYGLSQPIQAGLSSRARDREMAKTLMTLKKLWFPRSKAVLWAHNVHLQRDGKHSDSVDLGFQNVENMGQYLSEAWGKQYFPIALVSYETSINWPQNSSTSGCQSFAPPTAHNSVEKMLHDLNSPYLVVDLTAMKKVANPFFSPATVFQYGPFSNVINGKIDRQFGGLIYLEDSKAMNSPIWGSCDPTLASAIIATDGDFEECTGEGAPVPEWFANGQGFGMSCDNSTQANGQWSARLQSSTPHAQVGTLGQCVALHNFSGTVTLSGSLSTLNVANGYAGLFLETTDVQGNQISSDGTSEISGTNPSAQYSASLSIPKTAAQICFGVLLTGDGTVWADGLVLKATASPHD